MRVRAAATQQRARHAGAVNQPLKLPSVHLTLTSFFSLQTTRVRVASGLAPSGNSHPTHTHAVLTSHPLTLTPCPLSLRSAPPPRLRLPDDDDYDEEDAAPAAAPLAGGKRVREGADVAAAGGKRIHAGEEEGS